MKILMLVSRVPWPLEKGDKLRAYNQLKFLAIHHEIHLCCLSDQAIDERAISELKKITEHIHVFRLNKAMIGWRLIRALMSDKPFQVHYFYQSAIAVKIRRIVDQVNPDHIYCQLIRTSEYVKNLHNYKKTLDYMDALSSGLQRRTNNSPWWMRMFVREEHKRLLAYENLIFDYFDHHTIISAQDRQLIFHAQRSKIHIIPNGIDADFFSPSGGTKKYEIAFTGNMSYPPNVDCALRLGKEILPLIQKVLPGTRLLIAGANPLKSVTALASEHVHVTGWIPDIRSAYNESKIFMAPMRIGSGLQNKLLEAMSMKLACITSDLAAKAMHAIHGKHMMIGQSNEEFAALAIKLLNDKPEADNLAEQGRDYVVQNFNWVNTVGRLQTILETK